MLYAAGCCATERASDEETAGGSGVSPDVLHADTRHMRSPPCCEVNDQLYIAQYLILLRRSRRMTPGRRAQDRESCDASQGQCQAALQLLIQLSAHEVGKETGTGWCTGGCTINAAFERRTGEMLLPAEAKGEIGNAAGGCAGMLSSC